MKRSSALLGLLASAVAVASFAACGDAGGGGGGGGGTSSSSSTNASAATGLVMNDQTPPQDAAGVETWLAAGGYKNWKCESAVHASRDPSPHGFNRICSNGIVEANATSTANWPKGAAAVKELYASATATTPVGYAVYVKVDDDSGAGANWYWYERVPLDSMAPHDANGVVANGFGGTGPAKEICVGCHAGAGSNLAHTPSPGGRDFVYTPVH